MPKSGPPTNPGDWECVQCGNINFKFRKVCNKCKSAKPVLEEKKVKIMGRELGEKAAEFSNGLFSAKDWACSACGNINFARRLACNICGVQKFKAVEDRSGVGGGFNDREGLEYKEVIVEEGEYDEFGRKKKRKRNTTARIADPLEGGMDTGNMNTKSTTDFLKENHPQGLHGNPKSDSQSRSRSPVKCKDHKYTSRRRSSSRSSSRTRLKDSRSRSRSRSFSRSS